MSTHEELYELPDDGAVMLIRDTMARTTADLPPLPDLVGPARAQGRRRKARVRFAIGGGALAVAALSLTASVALPAGGGGQRAGGVAGAPVRPSGSASAPPPLLTSPGPERMADLPEAERIKQENFQKQAVPVLQSLLPQAVGTVTPTGITVREYLGTKDGKTFTITFSVRPSGGYGVEPCREVADQVCSQSTLPGGIEAYAGTQRLITGLTSVWLGFEYGKSNVGLSVGPHEGSNISAPITNEQILELAKDPAFLDLVKAADADPVEKGMLEGAMLNQGVDRPVKLTDPKDIPRS